MATNSSFFTSALLVWVVMRPDLHLRKKLDIASSIETENRQG
jgi:hypothetical protein